MYRNSFYLILWNQNCFVIYDPTITLTHNTVPFVRLFSAETTGPIFTKILRNIVALVALFNHAYTQHYSISFLNARATKVQILPFFAQNWLPWQYPLRYRKKRLRSIICIQNAFIRCKDCENRSSGSWDNLSPRNHKKIKKEEINASKIYNPVGNLAERAKQ